MSDTDWSEGWHYSAANGNQEGPISATKLVQLHIKKLVRPEDQVWHPSLPDWCTLREAWSHLRPYKQALSTSSSSSKRRKDYSVEEVSGTAADVEKTLKAKAFDGWTYDSAIVLAPDRCLLVFRR